MTGLLQQVPFGTGSDDQPAQVAEEVLKKKREKLAQDKLGIQPETDNISLV